MLRLDLDRVVVDASRTYPMVGVYSFGRGLFDREPVEAGKTSYRHFFRLKADHIIMSQLFGWEGALALSSPQFTGKFVSPQFPTFLCDELKLDRLFLKWLMKRPMFWQDLGSRASGMGDRRRTLNPDALFKCEIPLPSLSEQQRIVARIEELAVKIEEARGLRRQAVAETTSFVSSLHLSLAGERVVALGDILRLDESKEEVQFGQQYPQVGVKGFGQGLFPRETLEATQTTYRGFNRLYEGAIVLSQVKGWEGAIAACGSDLAGRYVSPEYRTFRCLEGRAIPEYLAALVTTPWFWTQLKDVTRGVGARRERTRPEQFLQMKLPMPEIDRQAKAVPAFDKLQILKRLQAETAAELDALPPSVLDKAFKGEL
ncbi:MAG: restriction endonuclease subunit S [Deltaproteobacteria bacterium]|nr:restriction endonuclease subunit S [Deltaproteobacteria bacterium]